MADFSWDSKVPAEVESKSFSVPPIGEYDFMVVEVEKTFAQSSGNPMLKVRLDLQGADGSVWDNLVLTEKAMFKVVTFLESIGLKEKGKDMTLSIGEAADKAVGLEGRLKIKHETYNGEARAKVDHYIVTESKKADKAPKKTLKKKTAAESEELPFPIDEDVPFTI